MIKKYLCKCLISVIPTLIVIAFMHYHECTYIEISSVSIGVASLFLSFLVLWFTHDIDAHVFSRADTTSIKDLYAKIASSSMEKTMKKKDAAHAKEVIQKVLKHDSISGSTKQFLKDCVEHLDKEKPNPETVAALLKKANDTITNL